MDAEYFMREALAEARAVDAEGEVPVGAVVVRRTDAAGHEDAADGGRDASRGIPAGRCQSDA